VDRWVEIIRSVAHCAEPKNSDLTQPPLAQEQWGQRLLRQIDS